MVAKGGAALLKPDAVEALKKRLIPRAALITPNIPEAELLLGDRCQVTGVRDMQTAAEALLKLGCKAILIKGGHLDGDAVTDILMEASDTCHLTPVTFTSPRIQTRHTHGTGCTLASAVATGIAQGLPLEKAVKRARDYVQAAIRSAPELGKGHGPLNHAVKMG